MANNSIIPFLGKATKGTTKFFLVALTEHDNNSVARKMDLSTNVITTYVKNHSTGHITEYISHNPKKISKIFNNVASLSLKK